MSTVDPQEKIYFLDADLPGKWHTSPLCPQVKGKAYTEGSYAKLTMYGYDVLKDKCGWCQINDAVREDYRYVEFPPEPEPEPERIYPFGLWQVNNYAYNGDPEFKPEQPATLLWCKAMPCTPSGYTMGWVKRAADMLAILEEVNRGPLTKSVKLLLACPGFEPQGRRSKFTAAEIGKFFRVEVLEEDD